MRCSMSSTRACDTRPAATAARRDGPKYTSGSRLAADSTSSPASAAGTAEWVPPQSDIAQPGKPQPRFSTMSSRKAFSAA